MTDVYNWANYARSELAVGRVDPRIGSGRVTNFGGMSRVGSGPEIFVALNFNANRKNKIQTVTFYSFLFIISCNFTTGLEIYDPQ